MRNDCIHLLVTNESPWPWRCARPGSSVTFSGPSLMIVGGPYCDEHGGLLRALRDAADEASGGSNNARP